MVQRLGEREGMEVRGGRSICSGSGERDRRTYDHSVIARIGGQRVMGGSRTMRGKADKDEEGMRWVLEQGKLEERCAD